MTMTLALVLGTAILHASWNALAKSVGDRWVASALQLRTIALLLAAAS